MEIGRRTILQLSVLAGLGLLVKPHGIMEVLAMEGPETFEVVKTEEEWKALLTPAQYYVLREEGTERPFTNAYDANKATGTYHCAGCDLDVFSSGAKYDSKTGWPSFWQPFSGRAVRTKTDWKLFYPRTEVHCRRCGGHLGHIFNDGPPPTGLRYCINSAALQFREA